MTIQTLITPARADWIAAGCRLLAQRGPSVLRVEPLAAELGAPRGDFYNHFKDLRAFQNVLLEAWAGVAVQGLAASAVLRGLPPAERLLVLADRISILPEVEATGQIPALEPAIRDWARIDPQVRAVLRRVDQQRLADLAALLAEVGLEAEPATRGAEIFYAALIGLEGLRLTGGMAMRAPLIALARSVLSLR